MTILLQIIIGVLMMVGGILLLKYNYQVTNNLTISFAEEHLGPGGSYLLWKILAGLLIIAGFTVIFGIYDNIIAWVLSPLTNAISPNN
jgi:hypothetical protein